jgi:hypothetical protein
MPPKTITKKKEQCFNRLKQKIEREIKDKEKYFVDPDDPEGIIIAEYRRQLYLKYRILMK